MNERTITACGFSVEIELASEDSEEVATAAEEQARAFLKRVDALPGQPPDADPDFFHMGGPVPKEPERSYELYVENFEHVSEGTVYTEAGRVPRGRTEIFDFRDERWTPSNEPASGRAREQMTRISDSRTT